MIDVLIVSKDRAMQLHLLLESIERNALHLFDNIRVVTKTSGPDYRAGYYKLRESLTGELNDKTFFYTEQSNGLIPSMLCMTENQSSEFVCGFTDDCVVFRPITQSYSDIEHFFALGDDAFTFTLRMGLNTTTQNYITGQKQPFLWSAQQFSNEMIMWNWREYGVCCNYGYPWTLDGHIYRTTEFIRLTKISNAKNLREWEGGTIYRGVPGAGSTMASFLDSPMICLANNCVQDPPMVSGTKYPYSAKELNDRYLQGETIDLDKLDFSKVVSSHEEKEFTFKCE